MAFVEDLDLFLADFGVPVVSGSTSGIGILDMPSSIIADGVVLTTDYKVTCKTSLFGVLKYGDSVTVSGISYTVREVMRLDDGSFCDLMLMRDSTANVNITTTAGVPITTLSGISLVTQ